ncbi:enoyl-CoA hydratase [Mycolicibacterium phlei]|uniref:Enoyl-CoA hydratase n=1 Tax=Mycolicibacterium phlei DSM 43239 = CCUG 21000 TaxID=1226750 RepID=A0A5N5UTH8_MYCPH|nr:enoyl-CoA hydratase-related protein [Mycolicibacterium phlei]VEG08835.1 enoyl-CoA hydratase [Mycobacteroides chelonae]AMO60716.1 1,2-epoxyphenylacetyl-CoA isomerase [Mycolicibacterium phlei]KAB7751410.1 enoyl-CoA hydratase [Mycolicibacterium phlei DSM 43239 = CCUG 21000]KXW68051.1 enoyl-CoA hydratase [Mycolicibacterium phlei DSM 43239 = CCUG 21000]KXW78623.1 enoyl-CoA hydratase [Mycolicibacterium phlei DSM 43071]
MTEADSGEVRIERDDAILRLTLDRPDRRNSLSYHMIGELITALTEAATDDSLRAVHVRSAGPDFCSGADVVAANSGDRRPRTGDLVRRIPHGANRVVELVTTLHLPVVCTVRGWAVGLGANLALAADFTVAADDATFWEPFIGRGFSPDSGSTWLLPRLVGLARARRMLLLGEKVSGADAADWGLIHQAVPADRLDTTADELVARLAAGPTVALGLAKQAIAYGQQATLADSMTQELFNVELSCRTSDFKEGLAAFRERRRPEFRGR